MPVEPILLLSPDGMLGRAFEELLRERGLAFRGASRPDFDLTKPATVERFFEPGLASVINCSAWTDVDGAEAHEDEATAVNSDGVAQLASLSAGVGATLVHFSTDYVFDGCASEPYRTDETLAPLNAYGRSKAAGERAILASGAEHLIVRTSWLYAPWAKNFVLTMRGFGREKNRVRVVDDQVGRPTSARYLAERTLALLDRGARGIFHVTDGGRCSWFHLAREVMRLSGSSCAVEPCSSAEFLRPARRPAYSIFDLSKTEALLGPSRDWKENVAEVLREVERNEAAKR